MTEKGIASVPKMDYIPGFSLQFPKELNYGYLRFEEKGENFFEPKVTMAKFIKCKKKSGIMKNG